MSTRSRIGILRADGSIDSIYCHLDGYPEGVGLEIYKNYNNPDKINKLIQLGDISHLEENIEPDPSKPHKFGYDTEQPNVVVAYHRDRGEKLNVLHSKDILEFNKYCLESDQEYAYLYEEYNHNWLFAKIPLEEDSRLEYDDLSNELEKQNLIDSKEDKFDKLLWKIIGYEKENNTYEFNDNYNNDEEAFESLKENVSEKGFNKIKEDLKDTMNDFKEDGNDRTSNIIYKWTKLLLHEIEDYEKSDEINL